MEVNETRPSLSELSAAMEQVAEAITSPKSMLEQMREQQVAVGQEIETHFNELVGKNKRKAHAEAINDRKRKNKPVKTTRRLVSKSEVETTVLNDDGSLKADGLSKPSNAGTGAEVPEERAERDEGDGRENQEDVGETQEEQGSDE